MSALRGIGTRRFLQLVHVRSDGNYTIFKSDSGFAVIGRSNSVSQAGGQPRSDVPGVGNHDAGILQLDQQGVEIVLECSYGGGSAGGLILGSIVAAAGSTAQSLDFSALLDDELAADNQRIALISEIVPGDNGLIHIGYSSPMTGTLVILQCPGYINRWLFDDRGTGYSHSAPDTSIVVVRTRLS